jgi:hypothetical protein
MICALPFTTHLRKPIECTSCGNRICTDCIKHWLLTTDTAPTCMVPECTMIWDRKMIEDNLSRHFSSTKYKKHQLDILFTREMGLIEQTMPYVEVMNTIYGIVDDIRAYKQERKDLKPRLNDAKQMFTQRDIGRDFSEEAEQHAVEYSKLSQAFDDVGSRLRSAEILHTFYMRKYNDMETKGVVGKRYTHKCPGNDCPGLLDDTHHCAACGVETCHTCLVILDDEEHTCDPDVVKSIQLINKDCRACPTCFVSIHKIYGCDQMYCTKCHTAFSWKTGEVEKGVIHNPHYYEYMRQQNNGVVPRNPMDIPCGGVPNDSMVKAKVRLLGTCAEYINNVVRVNRKSIMMQHTLRQSLRTSNLDIRVKFVMKKMTEAAFKKALYYRETQNACTNDIIPVVEMVSTVTLDMIQRFVANDFTATDAPLMQIEWQNLIAYFNTVMHNIGDIHKIIPYALSEDGIVTRVTM